VPTWHEGDKALVRPGFQFEILAIGEDTDGDGHGTWTVRRC
jgi:hypothetical protein